MSFSPVKKGQMRGQSDATESTELDTKLDYDIIVFNQLERTLRSGSKEGMQSFNDNVILFETTLWPYIDDFYKNKITKEEEEKVKSIKENTDRAGKINSQINTNLEYKFNMQKLRALMNLAKRMNLTPSRKMKQYI